MQPLSGNQLLELRTSLLKMPLVLRLPRKMHLCRSSSNLPRLPSFLKMLQNPHVLVTFQWMHNPLHLPHKTTSERPKCLRDPQFLTLLTSKCASRHNAVHFFDISTSKSAPRPPVFNTFYFQMCFAPQRRALFRHSTSKISTVFNTFYVQMCSELFPSHFQNWSETPSVRTLQFLTHFTSKCASRHNAVHFFNISTSKSGPALRCFVPFHFEIGFAPQRRATFHLSSPQMSPHPPL